MSRVIVDLGFGPDRYLVAEDVSDTASVLDVIEGRSGRVVYRGPHAVVDIAGIAARLSVPKDTVNKWRHRGRLPDPDMVLAMGPVWYWDNIERWAAETDRLPS